MKCKLKPWSLGLMIIDTSVLSLQPTALTIPTVQVVLAAPQHLPSQNVGDQMENLVYQAN